jgi:hypothetical protein
MRVGDSQLVRTINTTVSERANNEYIQLELGELLFAQDIEINTETEELNAWDENLRRYKEVEELYDEIMKTVAVDHLLTNDGTNVLINIIADDNSLYSCPSAPYDQYNTFSAVFLGFKNNYLLSLEIEKDKKRMETTGSQNGKQPTLRAKNRRASKDEFGTKSPQKLGRYIKHRKNAFVTEKVANLQKLEAQQPSDFGILDYRDFLKIRCCDYLQDLIIPQENTMDETALNEREMREKLAREVQLRERQQRLDTQRKEIMTFDKGKWKIGVLSFMSGLTPENGPELKEDILCEEEHDKKEAAAAAAVDANLSEEPQADSNTGSGTGTPALASSATKIEKEASSAVASDVNQEEGEKSPKEKKQEE